MHFRKVRYGRMLMSLLLAGSMTMGLAGCSGPANESENEAVNNNSTSEQANGNSAAVNDESAEEERPTLTMWSTWRCNEQVSDPGDTAFYQAIEEACNVNLEFVDSSGGKDSLSILMGTDDLPDIIYEWDGNVPGGVQKALADGSILALNDLMDSGYLPNFKSYLESDPEVDKLCRNDDGLYAWTPMIRLADSPLVFSGNMIRQDWLDELGLEVPSTIDEMEQVLLAFKEKKGCDAGYSVAYKDYSKFVMSYGICENFYVENDEVKYGFIEPSYKDFLTTFNRWYGNGILDPDAFAQDIDAFYAKIASEKTGFVWGNTGGELGKIETMKADNQDMNFVPIPYPTLNEGDDFPVDVSNYRVSNVGMMIAATCENPEAAARVLDYVYGEEGHMLANFGQEGISYEMKDGEPVFTDLVTNNPDGLSIQQALSFYAGSNNKPFLCDRRMMMQTYALQVQKDSLDAWSTPNAKIKQMPPVTMTAEEAQEFNQIMTDINTYTDEMKLKFIMGTESLDNYTVFVENIGKMNIERAIELQQTAYDRYLNR